MLQDHHAFEFGFRLGMRLFRGHAADKAWNQQQACLDEL
jgi:hypothetical protein